MTTIIGDGGHAKVVRSLQVDTSPLGRFVAIGDNRARKRVAAELAAAGWVFPVLIHPKAVLPEFGATKIGAGTVIMAGAIIQPGCEIGEHCIINTGATVDHDCTLGDFVHIAPGAHLCGGVRVGEGTLIVVGVGIAPNTVIPPWSLVKARRLEICPL